MRHGSPCILRLTSLQNLMKIHTTWLTLYSEIDKFKDSEKNSIRHGSPCILRLTSLKNLRKTSMRHGSPCILRLTSLQNLRKIQCDMAHPVF